MLNNNTDPPSGWGGEGEVQEQDRQEARQTTPEEGTQGEVPSSMS